MLMATRQKKFEKYIALFLVFLMLYGCVPIAELASKKASAKTFYPKDKIELKKIADGTHRGSGSETFINSRNGYRIADDTENDGVVSSGDYVSYKFKMSIPAGPERTLSVKFIQEGSALNLADFGNNVISSSEIESKWDPEQKVWTYKVPRGISAQLEGVYSVKAKDTKGQVVKNNIISAELVNRDYVYKVKTESVTVVSAPLADLMVEVSGAKRNEVLTQKDKKVYFNIIPNYINYNGYSKAGVTNSGTWHTDIDVSDFPRDTKFIFDGKEVEVSNGKIKDIKAEGIRSLTCIVDEKHLPSEENKNPKNYTIKIEPYDDSFQIGESKNIKDIGSGKDRYYSTANANVGGNYVTSLRGITNPNNNYATATWIYKEEPEGEIWSYNVARPYKSDRVLFDDANIYYDGNREDWYNQGAWCYPKTITNNMTSDNDFYGVINIFEENIKEKNNKYFITGISLNTGSSGSCKDSYYDTTIPVMVFLDGKYVKPELYSAYFRENKSKSTSLDGDDFIESRQALSKKQNQCKVVLDMSKLDGKRLSVYVPMKAGKYDSRYDMHKTIKTVASSALTTDVNKKHDYTTWDIDNTIVFPMKPSLTASLSTAQHYGEGPVRRILDSHKNFTGKYSVGFTTHDKLANAFTDTGYSIVREFEFDDIYDIDTFKTYDQGYKVVSCKDNRVIVKKDDCRLDSSDGDGKRYIDNMTFYIDTKININKGSLDKTPGSVKETVYLTYPGMAGVPSGKLSGVSSDAHYFDNVKSVSSSIRAQDDRVEFDRKIKYDVNVSANTSGFSQDIYLPHVGDAKNIIPIINKANGSEIDINEKTGYDNSGYYTGKGRSKFQGDYKIDSIKLSDFAKDTTIDLFYVDSRGSKKTMTLPVKTDGTVDVSKARDITFNKNYSKDFMPKIRISSNSKISSIQSSGVKAEITLNAYDNRQDDVYVMWLDSLKKYKSETKLSNYVSWPDYTEVEEGSVTGHVFEDVNEDSLRNENEGGFEGVSVSLEKAAKGDSKYEFVRTIKTDKNGYYCFDRLHSGFTYRVSLPNINRNVRKDQYIDIKGDTSDSAKDGALPKGVKNRFGVYERTKQTYSYINCFNASSRSDATIYMLDSLSNHDDVDFGFHVSSTDLALDVEPAEVTQREMFSDVSWKVKVKNNSNHPLSGVELSSRMDTSVLDLKTGMGYMGYVSKITGEPLSACGYERKSVPADGKSGLVATTDGVWRIVDVFAKSFNEPSNLSKLEGEIEGNVVEVIGYDASNWYDYFSNSDQNASGNLIMTDKAVYYRDDMKIKKFDDIKGKPIKAIGNRCVGNYHGGVLVATTDGYYYVCGGLGSPVVKKITGVTGDVIDMGGEYPKFEYHVGPKDMYFTILTTDGAWFVWEDYDNFVDKPNIEAHKIDDIKGDMLTINAPVSDFLHNYSVHSIIVTTEGLWATAYGKVVGHKEYDGSFLGISRMNFWQRSSLYFILHTTSGSYNVDWDYKSYHPGNENSVCNIDVKKVEGLSGKFKQAGGLLGTRRSTDSSAVIETSDGLFLIGNDRLDKVDISNMKKPIKGMFTCIGNLRFSFFEQHVVVSDDGFYRVIYDKDQNKWILDKFDYIKGKPILLNRNEYCNTNIVATTEGFWQLTTNKDERHQQALGNVRGFIREKDLEAKSETKEDIYTLRKFELPTIEPGEEIVLDMKGTVINPTNSRFDTVANQVWVTSDSTPRQGITTSLVTGDGMPDGVPDKPAHRIGYRSIPKSINRNISIDEEQDGFKDDLADQENADIKGRLNSGGPVLSVDSSLSGKAFFDSNNNGVLDKDEKMAEGLKVTAINREHGISYTAKTNSDGNWRIDDVITGNYDVYYDLKAYKHDDKVWSSTKYGGKTNNDSDILPSGVVDKPITSGKDGTDGLCDAGLVSVDGSLKVTKGVKHHKDGSDDFDKVYSSITPKDKQDFSNATSFNYDIKTGRVADDDSLDTTMQYIFRIDNNGKTDVTNVKISDKTSSGNSDKINDKLAYYENNKFVRHVKLESGTIKEEDGKPFVMKKGSYLEGTFGVVFTKDNLLHESNMTASAGVIHEDTIVSTVTDNDGFKSEYIHRPSRLLNITKYGVTNVDDKDKKPLSFVTFDIKKVENPFDDKENYKLTSLGKYATNEDGKLSIRLDAGLYQITEVKGKLGYLKPNDSWYVDVSYNENGDVVTKVSASSQMPYISSTNGEKDGKTWGDVQIYNYSMLQIPITGGKTLYILLFGFVILGFGTVLLIKKRQE